MGISVETRHYDVDNVHLERVQGDQEQDRQFLCESDLDRSCGA